MLNEAPKKRRKAVDYAHPNGWQLFWRTQRECWRRMVTPFLMYLFMGLLLLACQAIPNMWAQIGFGILCIAGGGFYNGHLCYQYGKLHYGALVAGELHRKNEEEGISSAGDHHVEREYSPWKGFYIGFLVGVPVIILGCLAGALFDRIYDGTVIGPLLGGYSAVVLIMFAAWAIMPVLWIRNYVPGMGGISLYWSLVMIVLPIVISGIFYILGAYAERRSRKAESERERHILEARLQAKEEVRVQTEEQRKKTLQSKKKK